MKEGYIKLQRNFLKWEWYSNPITRAVFIHCLLKANWKETEFKGMTIPAGSFISSYAEIARETGYSIQNVRTAIANIKSTDDLTDEVTNGKSGKTHVFTVVKYAKYQSTNKGTNSCSKSKLTTSKEIKNKEYLYIYILYGKFQNVKLTEDEYNKLVEEYGSELTDKVIEYLDSYIQDKPDYKSKSHYAAIKRWVIYAVKEAELRAKKLEKEQKRLKKQPNSKPEKNAKIHNFSERDYNYDELMKDIKK